MAWQCLPVLAGMVQHGDKRSPCREKKAAVGVKRYEMDVKYHGILLGVPCRLVLLCRTEGLALTHGLACIQAKKA